MNDKIKTMELIDNIVGTWEQQRKRTAAMELSDRIRSNAQFEKTRAKVEKIIEKHDLTTTLIVCGNTSNGVTKDGKRYTWTGNTGLTERSRYCGSLWIEGEGTIFTSGKIDKVLEYLLKR